MNFFIGVLFMKYT